MFMHGVTQEEIEDAYECVQRLKESRNTTGIDFSLQWWANVYRVKNNSSWRVICTMDWQIIAILKRDKNTYRRAKKYYRQWLKMQ